MTGCEFLQFCFSELKNLFKIMRTSNETRTTFSFKFNNKPFSCIFIIDIVPFRLYLSTIGNNPLVFEFEVHNHFMVNGYMDKYKELLEYLELKYNPDKKFTPVSFFEYINSCIPTTLRSPKYHDVLMVAAHRRNIEEINKIYFYGWRLNKIGEKVSNKNFEKTRCAFGDHFAKLSVEKNISSRWTDVLDDEHLEELNTINSK